MTSLSPDVTESHFHSVSSVGLPQPEIECHQLIHELRDAVSLRPTHHKRVCPPAAPTQRERRKTMGEYCHSCCRDVAPTVAAALATALFVCLLITLALLVLDAACIVSSGLCPEDQASPRVEWLPRSLPPRLVGLGQR